jgi:hypothetical protein
MLQQPESFAELWSHAATARRSPAATHAQGRSSPALTQGGLGCMQTRSGRAAGIHQGQVLEAMPGIEKDRR